MSKKNDSVCTIPLCFAYLFGGGFHASSGPGTEKMAGYIETIRIYNDPKEKRTFIRQMVQDFQEYEDISDFKASVFELKKEYFSECFFARRKHWLHWRKQPNIFCEYLPTSIRCI